jgi:transporter family-2 protein
MTSPALLILTASVIGAFVAFQALVNTKLQAFTGSILWAAVISFTVGTVSLLVVALLTRVPLPDASALARAPWWAWTGGLLGAAYVATVIVLVPRVSPVLLFGAIVFGQMLMLVAAEHFGLTGIAKHPVSAVRLAGVLLIVLGTVLCKR